MSESRELSVLIVDDEPVARDYLAQLLQLESGVSVAGSCVNGAEAESWLAERSVDVMMLDIRMPGVSGLELLERIPVERRPYVVFVTAFDEYALRAFEHEAVDYLLKPFDRKRLRETLDRVRNRVESARQVDLCQKIESLLATASTQELPSKIPVRNGKEVRLVPVEEIYWIEAGGNYVSLHLAQREHLLRSSLSEMKARLDPVRFVRIHRSIIVSLERIQKITSTGRGDAEVTLDNGETLTLSRRYREALEQKLGMS